MRHAISLLRHAISPSLAQRVPDEGGNQSDEACNQYVPGVNERRGAVVSTRILGQELRAWKPLDVPIEAFGGALRGTQRHSDALRWHSDALRGNQMGTPLMSQSKHLEVRRSPLKIHKRSNAVPSARDHSFLRQACSCQPPPPSA
jgi:hypothetical protein